MFHDTGNQLFQPFRMVTTYQQYKPGSQSRNVGIYQEHMDTWLVNIGVAMNKHGRSCFFVDPKKGVVQNPKGDIAI